MRESNVTKSSSPTFDSESCSHLLVGPIQCIISLSCFRVDNFMMPLRQRSPDFSKAKKLRCYDEFVRFNSVLCAKFTSISTNSKKEAYDSILQAVNAVTSTNRSIDGIKEKWQRLKKTVKAK